MSTPLLEPDNAVRAATRGCKNENHNRTVMAGCVCLGCGVGRAMDRVMSPEERADGLAIGRYGHGTSSDTATLSDVLSVWAKCAAEFCVDEAEAERLRARFVAKARTLISVVDGEHHRLLLERVRKVRWGDMSARKLVAVMQIVEGTETA